jgi:mono/diheme cytochrome c family protein
MKETIYLLAVALGLGTPVAAEMTQEELVTRGEYLVATSGCNDCHTPWKMGDNGPEPDMTRMLSGHPETLVVQEVPAISEPWLVLTYATNTAIAGPWGVSFTANLTPDPETGVLRDYSEEQFLLAMRTGLHLGQGRPILPPMPWTVYGQMTDDDLRSIYAYLGQIPAIRNKVQDPLPPTPAGVN